METSTNMTKRTDLQIFLRTHGATATEFAHASFPRETFRRWLNANVVEAFWSGERCVSRLRNTKAIINSPAFNRFLASEKAVKLTQDQNAIIEWRKNN